MNPSWSDGGIQLQGKTIPEENFAQVPVDGLGASTSGTHGDVANKIRQQLAIMKQKIENWRGAG